MTATDLLTDAGICVRKYDAEKAATRSYIRLFNSVKTELRRILKDLGYTNSTYTQVYAAYSRINRFDVYAGNLSSVFAEARFILTNN